MKASKFTDAQKTFILKQGADGHPVADICRKAGISQATYFNWKRRERQAEEAGGGFVAGQSHASGCLAPKTVRPGHKRGLVNKACCEWDVPVRRACRVL